MIPVGESGEKRGQRSSTPAGSRLRIQLGQEYM